MRSRISSALIAVGSLGVLLVAAAVIYGYTTTRGWVGVANKTLWDWLELFIVPIVIAVAGFLLSTAAERERELQQRERELLQAREQREREFELEDRRVRLEDQRAQADALQSYLDKMSQLLTDQGLRSKTDWLDDARVTARARSLAVLRSVGGRKKNVLLFLYEAQLINRSENGPLVGLSGADLTSTDLRYITLRNAALDGTQLENADLSEAKLSDINLGGANLGGADLSDADLRDAYLENADLREAKLDGVDLGGADLSGADMSNAKFRSANLANADLQRKDERGLNGANLSGADLTEASLSGADLSGANLYEAIGWTEEQLTAARSLEGATMPNGQKYEEWKKSRGEDGENSAP